MPISFLILAPLGLLALLVGGLAMAGTLAGVHPLLNGDGGLALLVSGVALILTAAFPLALRRLAMAEARK